MNLFEKITGRDITMAMQALQTRAQALPASSQNTWDTIVRTMAQYGDFSGRNLIPVLTGIMELLEIAAAEEREPAEVFGGDPAAFCDALLAASRNGDPEGGSGQ